MDETPSNSSSHRWLAGRCCVLLLLLIAAPRAHADDIADWAATPLMGWNSWDAYGQSVTEAEVKANADYMAQNLKQFGWEYMIIDVRWALQNATGVFFNDDPILSLDSNGRLVPDPTRFPSSTGGAGFKPL